MNKQTKKFHIDYGFGFPVKLTNVPMVRIRGKWTPHLNYASLARAVLRKLTEKGSRLTGNEVRFIRLHFEMTLQKFAKRFNVSHAAVMKWEKTRDLGTSMGWTTEKDIRLFVLLKLCSKSKEMVDLYAWLEEARSERQAPVVLDVRKAAA